MFAALGILLLIAGAILVFAVEKSAEGIDIAAIGWILIAGGGLSLLVAAIRAAGWMSMTNSKMHVERHASADGRHVVEETHTA